MIIKANSGNGYLMDVVELSRKLGVSPNTIRDWCAYGRLPHLKVNKFLRFDPEDINKWLEEKRIDLRED